MQVPAGEFKAHCLRLIEEVRLRRQEVVITKRGQPVAKLVPLEEPAPRPPLGWEAAEKRGRDGSPACSPASRVAECAA